MPKRTRVPDNHWRATARDTLDGRPGRRRVQRWEPRDRRAGPSVGPKTLAVRVRSRLRSERDSGGRGTHVTTRAGGLVATIRASLLRHGVCLGPARSRVPWRARRGVSLRAMRFRVRDGRFAEAKPRREPRRVVRARGAQRVHRGLGPSPESSRERKPGFPRTCCVAATRKRSEKLSRTRVKFLSRR